MKLKLGGALSFYIQGRPHQLDIQLDKPTWLSDVLSNLGIPIAEVRLVVVNGELIDLQDAFISPYDDVMIYSAVDGG
jgi:sulfur carrier protein ThiS